MNSKMALMLGLLLVTAAWPAPAAAQSVPTRLVTGLEGASGSTVGPDGALYVTEGAVGRDLSGGPRDRSGHHVRQRPA